MSTTIVTVMRQHINLAYYRLTQQEDYDLQVATSLSSEQIFSKADDTIQAKCIHLSEKSVQ
ncbi:8536_t:CDS:2, partial [Racocetra persica]